MNIKLGLILTKRCNAKCKHCYEADCSYIDDEDMPINDALKYIDEISIIAITNHQKFNVGFSGGEVFLLFKKLIELIYYAKEAGASHIGCVTNGFWGINKKDAFEKAHQLAKAGLNRIAFSVDDFHQETIHINHVRNAIEASQSAGLEIAIKTVVTKSTKRLSDVLKDISDLITDKSIICNEITYVPYNTNCISKQDLLVKNGIPDKPCNDHHIIILPNGTTFPCCNVGWSDTLILGNAKESSLSELLQNYNRSSLLAILQETGPSYFVPKLRENNIPIPDNSFVNECHLCHEILSNLKATEIIRALTYQWERDKISFIESLVGTE